MKKEGTIFIMEPERIVGLELQLELENNGFSVFQSHNFKLTGEIKNKDQVKVIIVDIDKVGLTDFTDMTKHFCPSKVSYIGISSGTHAIKEYEGVQLAETFMKPFDSKEIVSFVEKCFHKEDIEKKVPLTPQQSNRKYLDL